jgi:hypothetical protein
LDDGVLELVDERSGRQGGHDSSRSFSSKTLIDILLVVGVGRSVSPAPRKPERVRIRTIGPGLAGYMTTMVVIRLRPQS